MTDQANSNAHTEMASNRTRPTTWKKYLPLAGALVVAGLLKVALSISASVPFNGDEAVVGLMARHILEGERPVFFYGQAYMGSLDAWLVAGAFRLFGESVTSIRIVQSVLYLLYLITLWILARHLYKDRWIADLAVWLGAIPPVLVTTYTTATLGGYGESLVLGNLILWLGYEVTFGGKAGRWWAWLALGLTGGVGFWVLGIAGVYLLPVALIGLWKFKAKNLGNYFIALAGFMLGSSPWWLYNLSNGWEALRALAAPGLVQTTVGSRGISFLLLGLPALFGLRAPWTPEFFPWPLVFVALLVYTLAIYQQLRIATRERGASPGARALLVLFAATFLGVFLFTRFGIDATGRYLLPLYLLVLLLTAEFAAHLWKQNRAYGVTLVTIIMLVNGATTWIAAVSLDKITTQFDPITSFDNTYDDDLIAFLREHGETRGYTNYWVAFRLAFLTDEEIIYSPELPYKADLSYTTKDNRYPAYAETVDGSPRVAYITTKLPELDEQIARQFDLLGIFYNETQIGPFHIFYNLSRVVRPEELGYGEAFR